MNHIHHQSRNARRSRFAALVLGAGIAITTLLGGGVPGVASAAPPDACGHYSDKTTGRGYLWGQVKGTKPWAPGSNLAVVQPGPQYQPNPLDPKYYAIRKGGDSKGFKDDFLLLPTNRIKGIECPYLENGSQLNLWSAAWFQIPNYVAVNPAKPFALGVNSADTRGQDQLHIHLAQVYPDTLADLRAIPNMPTNLNNWMSTNYKLRINPHFSGGTRQFRVVKYRGTMPNLFAQLDQVLPGKEVMDYQSIGVVYAGQPNTWYLLNSTRNLPGRGTGLMDMIYGWRYK